MRPSDDGRNAPRPPSPWDRKRQRHPHFGWRLLLLAGLACAGFVVLLSTVPPQAWRQGDAIDTVRFSVIGLALLVSAAASRRSLAAMAGGLIAWGAIALVLVAAYGYRFELREAWSRVASELMPSQARPEANGSLSFARASDGHFHVDAVVDGQPVRFLVDTGASGLVLNRSDAQRLGYTPDRLRFTLTVETANGATRAMPIRLRRLAIGPLSFDDIPATINEGDLAQSLLGMTLLERLSRIEIAKDRLVIQP